MLVSINPSGNQSGGVEERTEGGGKEREGRAGGGDGAEKDYAFKNGPPHP